ncbi:MAG: HEAT repeat domain-containing protein, partial [Gemmatimonadaceae bacterium]
LAAPVALHAQNVDVKIHSRALTALTADAGQLAALAQGQAGELRQLAQLAQLGQMAQIGQLGQLGSLAQLKGLAGLASLGQLADLDLNDVGDLETVSVGRWYRDRDADHPLSGDEQQADSLYKRAREALGRGDYRNAASLFEQITAKYPKTRYAGDALYFRAFALYRVGDTGDLRSALGNLETLASKYSGSSVQGDARTLRVRICGELAKRGDERCTSEVEGIAAARGGTGASQGKQCPGEDDEDDERIAALNALLQMDSERALPILEKVLARRDACSVGLRRKAVFLVSQKGNAKAADILLNAAKTDPDKEVRGQALFWLGQTRDERAVDMLEDVLKNTTDGELQDKAIFGLSQHRSERAQQVLRNVALNSSMSRDRREQAIFWLGQKNGGSNATFLRELYEKIDDSALKEKIIFSASQQKNPENKTWMLGIITNEKESVDLRKNALFWASQNRSVSMDELGKMYEQLRDKEMKEQVIFAMSQRRDSDAVDRLLDIARTEKDKELRKKAIFWLSQSKDPRVAKFLEDLISK